MENPAALGIEGSSMSDKRSGVARLMGRLAILCLTAVLLGACGSSDKASNEYVEGSVDELYNKAMDELLAERYKQAAKLFDEVDRQHPYSVWSTRAQIMSAYSNYKNDKFDDAIIGLDRFIQLHPNDRDITYAYYLKGMSYYDQIKDVKRDQTSAREALKTFDEMNKRFPNSRYSRDVTRKTTWPARKWTSAGSI
jgi:outer membrane protein assembly factor BamD